MDHKRSAKNVLVGTAAVLGLLIAPIRAYALTDEEVTDRQNDLQAQFDSWYWGTYNCVYSYTYCQQFWFGQAQDQHQDQWVLAINQYHINCPNGPYCSNYTENLDNWSQLYGWLGSMAGRVLSS